MQQSIKSSAEQQSSMQKIGLFNESSDKLMLSMQVSPQYTVKVHNPVHRDMRGT